MKKEECLAINGINKKQAATIKRWFWAADKKGIQCRLETCETPEQVLSLVNASFKDVESVTTPVTPATKLEDMTIAELQELLDKIPALIEEKKQAQIADIDAQIAQLKEMKKELTK
ncbi:MAG: hypothetical protein HDS69_06010 [Bacteroidales bacterium]|nr:hypothetical protein [Bacteroidales bacterium]MBD5235309.1 hypothetical protein [Barnesiella sp.]MBD5257405.1 hypothetical protein [Barnesiella sp.]